MKHLPARLQFFMYSATYPSAMVHFKNSRLLDACHAQLCESRLGPRHEANLEPTLNGVAQFYLCVEENRKVFSLSKALASFRIHQVIIFCNTVTRVKLLARKMTHLGYPCLFFHPGLFQSERQQVLHAAGLRRSALVYRIYSSLCRGCMEWSLPKYCVLEPLHARHRDGRGECAAIKSMQGSELRW